MIWYDMIWYDMIWYDNDNDMIWYNTICCDMIWYMIWYVVYGQGIASHAVVFRGLVLPAPHNTSPLRTISWEASQGLVILMVVIMTKLTVCIAFVLLTARLTVLSSHPGVAEMFILVRFWNGTKQVYLKRSCLLFLILFLFSYWVSWFLSSSCGFLNMTYTTAESLLNLRKSDQTVKK